MSDIKNRTCSGILIFLSLHYLFKLLLKIITNLVQYKLLAIQPPDCSATLLNNFLTLVSVHLMNIGIQLNMYVRLNKHTHILVWIAMNAWVWVDCFATTMLANVVGIIIGLHRWVFAVKWWILWLKIEIFIIRLNNILVRNSTYGESCTTNACDGTLLLTCGSSGYCVCSGSLYWNGTYCGI